MKGMLRLGRLEMKEIDQICVVVKDIKASMKHYWNLFKVGPCDVYTLAPPELTDTTVRGKPKPYSMKIALTTVGHLALELIQPLEGESIYKEFLAEKGEGLHHIACFKVDDIDGVIKNLEGEGVGVLQSGRWQGGYFAYMDTEKALGMVVELVKRTRERPPPEETYP